MKKISFWVLMVLTTQTVLGQKGFNFGLNVAPVISSVRADSAKKEFKGATYKSSVGFKGGLMVGLGFAENVGIQTGVNILLAGFKGQVKTLTPNPTNKYSLTAVEIPLLLKMRTNDLASGIHAKGYFGGSIGINVGAKVDANTDQSFGVAVLYEKGKNTITNHFQPFYTWFGFGAGIDWDLEGIGMLDLAIVYNLGLSNIIKPNYELEYTPQGGSTTKVKPYDNLRLRMNYIGLNIGFWFPTGSN